MQAKNEQFIREAKLMHNITFIHFYCISDLIITFIDNFSQKKKKIEKILVLAAAAYLKMAVLARMQEFNQLRPLVGSFSYIWMLSHRLSQAERSIGASECMWRRGRGGEDSHEFYSTAVICLGVLDRLEARALINGASGDV